jgi:putative oxidoreductase
MRTELEKNTGALLLRTTVGGLMLFHGVDKVIGGIAWLPGLLEKNGLPGALAYGVYLGEVVAPVLLILGVAMRSAAACIAFTMGMAVYLLHPEDVFKLGEHGEYALELHLFYAIGAIAAALVGPGRFAVPLKGRWARL